MKNIQTMKYLFLLAFIFLSSCYTDVKSIRVHGIVTDLISKKPIYNLKLFVLSWSYGHTPDGSYTSCDTSVVITDEKGRYSCHFNSGAFIEVSSLDEKCEKGRETADVTSQDVVLDLNVTLINNRK